MGKSIIRISKSGGEKIVEIPISELYPPEFHPFAVKDDDAMTQLVKSVEKYGVREPGIARPHENGYELLCGNRRKRACEIAGIATMPVIIRELDDDSANITMVDSNLEQRESLLYSEKAWAYRVKLEALNHSGKKGNELSVEVLVNQTGESKNQIYRLVRLTELVPALLDKVDTKRLAFTPAVELSYLSRAEQKMVADAMEKYEVKPSLSQTVRLKKAKSAAPLTEEFIVKIVSEVKRPTSTKEPDNIHFRDYFPSNYTQGQIDSVIVKLLIEWRKRLLS